jgi:hypothetical protein
MIAVSKKADDGQGICQIDESLSAEMQLCAARIRLKKTARLAGGFCTSLEGCSPLSAWCTFPNKSSSAVMQPPHSTTILIKNFISNRYTQFSHWFRFVCATGTHAAIALFLLQTDKRNASEVYACCIVCFGRCNVNYSLRALLCCQQILSATLRLSGVISAALIFPSACPACNQRLLR